MRPRVATVTPRRYVRYLLWRAKLRLDLYDGGRLGIIVYLLILALLAGLFLLAGLLPAGHTVPIYHGRLFR